MMTGLSDTRRTRLALLDSHGLFRESLGHLLGSEPDLDVVGQCSRCIDALELLKTAAVDLVLLEFGTGEERCEEFIAAARRSGYEGRFLMVTAGVDPARSAAALRLGASGIFLKCNSSGRLLQAIRLVAGGEAWVDPKVIQLIAERYPQQDDSLGSLTPRERVVLQGVLDGFTNKRIGSQIGVSESSIKATLQQLFDKAGVRSRSQLVRVVLDRTCTTNGAVKDPSESAWPIGR